MLDVGWATKAAQGQRVCGDLIVWLDGPTRVLIALIDGLGHGAAAAMAAEAAASHIRQASDADLEVLFESCDRAIRHTCGVTMTVVRIEPTSLVLEHAAVGDVELRARSREPIEVSPIPGFVGIGGRMRKVVATRHQLHEGDLLVLYTDGVSRRLRVEQLRGSATRMAKAVLSGHARDHDDAGCVVVLI